MEDREYALEAKDSFPVDFPSRANTVPIEPKEQQGIVASSLSRAVSISYSHSKYARSGRLTFDVDESLILSLVSSNPRDKKLHSQSLSLRLSLTRVSSKPNNSKRKKKVRFNDNVVIHTIEYEYEKPRTVHAMSETYVLVITLREIWSK